MNLIKKTLKKEDRICTIFEPNEIPTSMIMDDKSGMHIGNKIYPFRGRTDDRPGLYDTGMKSPSGKPVLYRKDPEDNDPEYDDVTDVINFGKQKSNAQYMRAKDELNKMSANILSNVDNVFLPIPKSNDDKCMQAFKLATDLKECDIHKYQPRFGKNFNNDKRLFEKDHISLDKMIDLGNNLDMKITVTIEDKDESVPNPIGKKVVADLSNNDYPIYTIDKDGNKEEVIIK